MLHRVSLLFACIFVVIYSIAFPRRRVKFSFGGIKRADMGKSIFAKTQKSIDNFGCACYNNTVDAPSTYSSLAQSVERVTVNHDVVGSSPTGGAKEKTTRTGWSFLCFSFGGLERVCRFRIAKSAAYSRRRRLSCILFLLPCIYFWKNIMEKLIISTLCILKFFRCDM